jgi:protein-S-isoprenylcysteine O-methyltransferase Ste14
MLLMYRYLLALMWGSWALYWWAASTNVKNSIRRESFTSRISHIAPLTLAILLLLGWPNVEFPAVGARFLPRAEWVFWTGASLTACGILFSVWARLHLGRNWSATVTIKDEHELIATGPYRFVRHPIYTGLLVAIVGTAVARGDWQAVLAVAIAFWALWRKLKIEERWLTQEFEIGRASCRERV